MNLKEITVVGEPWTNTRKIWRFPYTIGRVLLTRGNPDGLGRKRNTETDAKRIANSKTLNDFPSPGSQGEEDGAAGKIRFWNSYPK
ncbi:hypothetical protein TNCV_2396021 [Trichonephila clavipes]|uniref:Uncharacterized protein n=1 Tax=Trichonephila clavipes TaxID=2585209 RepID=A0A8X6SVC9_TRICX|nr:hypothetical protein TNCV_2396021 [Trichonephila clavipes]